MSNKVTFAILRSLKRGTPIGPIDSCGECDKKDDDEAVAQLLKTWSQVEQSFYANKTPLLKKGPAAQSKPV